jgi:hypothetical protein
VTSKLIASLLLTVAVQTACAGDGTCDSVAKQAEADPIIIVPRVYFAVTGEGRLFFYSAPDQGCKLAGTFVIPGDSLIGYSEFKGWISVMYTTENGDPVSGWVRSERLRRTGTLGVVQ